MYRNEPTMMADPRTRVLGKQLLSISFFNLFLVALTGVWLRSFPFYDFPFLFKNVLHGHSHFAFGGWAMPVLVALMLRYIPFLSAKISYNHWRNVSVLLVGSSYGMLLTFPLGGYYVVSIIFSTISVLAGFYLAWLVFKASQGQVVTAPVLFLQWAMLYGILSSAGPFLTGPLIVMGYQGSPVYYNAIYFYLHFQYNGLFTFIVLALFYAKFFKAVQATQGIKVFFLMNCAVLPTFALSVLWTQPSPWFNVIGGWGAMLQLGAFYFLMKDFSKLPASSRRQPLLAIVFGALGLKFFLQLASAFPVVALLATEQRNFIIAYLHLVLLGFISTFVMAVIWPAIKFSFSRRTGVFVFLIGFFATEFILVLQSVLGMYTIAFPYFFEMMFGFSVLLPAGVLIFSSRPLLWSWFFPKSLQSSTVVWTGEGKKGVKRLQRVVDDQ